jgi:hypothetical protein
MQIEELQKKKPAQRRGSKEKPPREGGKRARARVNKLLHTLFK